MNKILIRFVFALERYRNKMHLVLMLIQLSRESRHRVIGTANLLWNGKLDIFVGLYANVYTFVTMLCLLCFCFVRFVYSFTPKFAVYFFEALPDLKAPYHRH